MPILIISYLSQNIEAAPYYVKYANNVKCDSCRRNEGVLAIILACEPSMRNCQVILLRKFEKLFSGCFLWISSKIITTFKPYTLSPAFPTRILKDRQWSDLDGSQSLFDFVPQNYYSQAGSTNLIKTISFPANCFVLAIDAPLPDGDKTELTKKLVSAVKTSHIKLANYKLQITITSLWIRT